MEVSQYNKAQRQLAAAYHDALLGEAGEIVKADLQKILTRPSFDPTNPHQTAFNEGERSLAARMLRLAQMGSLITQETAP